MTDSEFLENFFSKAFENDINEMMFYYSFKFPFDKVLDYLFRALSIPLSAFISYIEHRCAYVSPVAKDVVQFSSLNDATLNICICLKNQDDPGLSYVEIGESLLNDEKERKDGALRKYGENHAKTAEILGLTRIIDYTTYLTCVGYVFPVLAESQRNELLQRLAIRNPFFQKLILDARFGEVTPFSKMFFLAESTIKRRLPNVKTILNIIKKTTDISSKQILDNIKY